jgi:RNA polymerase sigma-70 factor (ECF subfamily)
LEYQPHKSLLDSCRKGDALAQHRLFHAYVKAMYSTALRIVQQQDEAEDVVQEAFIKAFNKLGSFKEEGSFGSWLKRIVVNTALNKVNRRKISWVGISEREEALADPDTEVMLELHEGYPSPAIIKQHIAQLPEGCQLVFNLHLMEGYPQKEVAEMLNISVSTVKSQYHRAKQLLKTSLSV